MRKKTFSGHKKSGQSILHYPEQKFIKYFAPKIPHCIETYHLTYMTIVWSIGVLIFGYLAKYNIQWLWGTSVMIVGQYLTDIFDGEVGRIRNTGLVKWGYFMDHFLDYIFMTSLLVGYSFFIPDKYGIMFFIIMIYGGFMVNSYVSFMATNEFRISYFGFGPTEGRILFIVINMMLIIFGKMYLSRFLPHFLTIAFIGLCMAVYKNQKILWDMDMANKKPKIPRAGAPIQLGGKNISGKKENK